MRHEVQYGISGDNRDADGTIPFEVEESWPHTPINMQNTHELAK